MMKARIVGLLGIWMVIAPFITNSAMSNRWNVWVVGVVTAVLGYSMTTESRSWERLLAAAVGIWLFISGFIPGLRAAPAWQTNDVVAGILLIIAGVGATRHYQPGGRRV